MEFDINQLDKIEYEISPGFEDQVKKYQNSILEEFARSPEGQELIKVYPDMGFWVERLIHFGIFYVDATLPQMSEHDVDEIVTKIFPRKIALGSPEDADDAMPELLAFWQFIESKYKLPNAGRVIRYLTKIEPEFNNIMNDPSRFGLTRSIMTMGRESGYDMTDQNQINEFVQLYNKHLMAEQPDTPLTKKAVNAASRLLSKKAKAKRKQKRKTAKASRKKNHKKK